MKSFNFRSVKSNLLKINNKVFGFLRSKRSKEFMTFLFFTFIAFLFWVFQSLNDESETSFKIPLKLTNIPENAVITDSLPSYIEVRLKDKGTALFSYMVNRFYPVEIDFNKSSTKNDAIVVKPYQLRAAINRLLLNSSNLISFSPDSISIYYTLSEGKKLPVRVPKKLSTIPQCLISGPITLSHDSVKVYAPANVLKKLRYVETDSLILINLSDTVFRVLPLRKIKGCKFYPDRITVRVPVEEFTTKKLELPVLPVDFPANMSIITFPTTVQLSCMVAISKFAQIKTEDFKVGINYKQVLTAPGRKQVVNILSQPDFVTNVLISPDSIEYILEERVPLKEPDTETGKQTNVLR